MGNIVIFAGPFAGKTYAVNKGLVYDAESTGFVRKWYEEFGDFVTKDPSWAELWKKRLFTASRLLIESDCPRVVCHLDREAAKTAVRAGRQIIVAKIDQLELAKRVVTFARDYKGSDSLPVDRVWGLLGSAKWMTEFTRDIAMWNPRVIEAPHIVGVLDVIYGKRVKTLKNVGWVPPEPRDSKPVTPTTALDLGYEDLWER